MYAAIITLLAASSAIAAPLTVVERATPGHYNEGYLESYDTYHTRYLAIGCSGKQGSDFFNSCCRPLLASETVEANRPAYCAAGYAASSSAQKSASSPAASLVAALASPAASPASASSSPATAASAPADAAVAAAKPTDADWTPASSSSSAASAPASTQPAESAPAQSGGYQYQGGFATFFYQGGNPGACGIVHSDNEMGIAIDGNGFWQNYGVTSEHCGKWINIKNTNNGKTVKAQVWDVCPTCKNDNSLDLSVGAFTAIASESDGMVPIEWSFA